MIERTGSTAPSPEGGKTQPVRISRTPDVGSAAADRFREALLSVSHRTARRPAGDDGLQDIGEDRSLSAQSPDVPGLSDNQGRKDDQAGRSRDGGVTETAAVSAPGQQAVSTPGVPPAAAGTAGEHLPVALFERVAAALDAPLAGLKPGEHSAFTVSFGGAHRTMSAHVQRGADGRIAVALALPGAGAPIQDALARDLRRHLAGKGFPDTMVRIGETLARSSD